MTTIEDKINLFSKIIYDKLNEEKEEKLKQFNQEAQTRIESEKENIEKNRKNLQRELMKKSNTKANEIIAKEKLNKQREILSLKDKLVKSTLDEIKEKLFTYVSSEDYKDYFIKLLQNTLSEVEEGRYFIILLERDNERFKSEIEEVIKKYNDKSIEIKISQDDFIGGIILKDFEGKFKVDNSLYSKLEESKEIIGVKVMEMLA